MDTLIDTLSFFFGALGVSILIFSLTYVFKHLFKLLDKNVIDTNKKLIKETIEELNKSKKK